MKPLSPQHRRQFLPPVIVLVEFQPLPDAVKVHALREEYEAFPKIGSAHTESIPALS